MSGELEIQEAAGRRSSAQAVVTRHVNALNKLLDKPGTHPLEHFTELRTKIVDALNRFNAVHDAILTLCTTHETTKEEHLEVHSRVTGAADEVLERLQRFTDNGTASGRGTDVPVEQPNELSPGSQKTLNLIQLALANVNLGGKTDELRSELREQDARHKKDSVALGGMIEELRKEMADLRKELSRPSGISTPLKGPGNRVTFSLSQSAIPADNPLGDTVMSTDGAQTGTLGAGSSTGQTSAALPDSTLANALSLQQQLLDQSALQHRSLVASLKAPVVTIPVFEGDPLEFSTFMNAFDELVDSVYDNPRSKLASLMTYCGEKPKQVIRSCTHVPAEEGYPLAREQLKKKYGSPYIVSQAWMDKLLGYGALKTAEQMESFSTDLVSCKYALESLGYLSELQCTYNMKLLVAKLPFTLRTRWRKHHRDSQKAGGSGALSKLIELVEEAAADLTDPAFSETAISQIRGRYEGGAVPTSRQPRFGSSQGVGRRAMINHTDENPGMYEQEFDLCGDPDISCLEAAYHTGSERPTCSACGGSQHFTSKCKMFRAMGPPEKLKFVKEKGLCVLCLSNRHTLDSCTLPWRCQEKKCSKRHHTALHRSFEPEPEHGTQSVNCTESSTIENVCSKLTDNTSFLSVSVPTLPLTPVILRKGSKTYSTYALLDQGSTLTMCHRRVVAALGATTTETTVVNMRTVNGAKEVEGGLYDFEICGAEMSNFLPVLEALEVEDLPISLEHRATASGMLQWQHLADLKLTCVPGTSVDLLIGTDNAHLLEPDKKRSTGRLFDPYAVLTPIGWTIFGARGEPKARKRERSQQAVNLTAWEPARAPSECIGQDVVSQVNEFFKLEEVPQCSAYTKDEQHVIDLWDREWCLKDGHIQLPVPFKQEPPCFSNNYYVALASLQALGRQFKKNPTRHRKYKAAMDKTYLMKKSEKVTKDMKVDPNYLLYLLHHDVDHPRKPDVSRIVKNGSHQYKGRSLNSSTYQGPDLMNSLTRSLLRFRRYKVGVTGDIDGMFDQVMVPVHQRDCQSYLWFKDGDPDQEVEVYRMVTHSFGTNWAPAAAHYALQKTIELEPVHSNPAVNQSVIDDFYVDDWLSSQETDEAAEEMRAGVTDTVAKGGFCLGKFTSNSRKVLAGIDVERRAKELARIDLFSDRLPQGSHSAQGGTRSRMI